jgi:DNA invertase Pin-like site-specific DNA recombinase
MKNKLELLQQFGKLQKHTKQLHETNYVVTLSRVSSKRQFEETLSLDNQDKYFEEHAARTGKTIVQKFGCTYESAKTDDRVEFKKMLEFVKLNNTRSSKKISEIWVYMTDRFSRTGIGGMKIAEQLREKYGVALYAITQPTSVKDESGIFSQNLQFLFSNYENKLRRKRMIDGMTAKFKLGEWVTRVPQGYSVVKEGKERKIVINDIGEKLRQAFIWKGEGMKNEEIIVRLKAMGVKMYKQLLTKTFKKPFYCGLINHGLLDGQIVEGKHPKLISVDLFLQVNEIHQSAGNYGVPHQKERDELPLKVFIRCSECNQPFTGYSRKKKTKTRIAIIFYYKCRTNGCKCNKNANQLHELFKEELAKYSVKENLVPAIHYELSNYYTEVSKGKVEQEVVYKIQLAQINKKIETIEEKHYALNEMNKETFEKFYGRYKEERHTISKLLQDCSVNISTLNESIFEVVSFSSKLGTVWHSGEIRLKEDLQKLIFPDGILYDRKTGAFRPPKINFIFELIARLSGSSSENKKGDKHLLDDLSPSAEKEGFDPPDL